MEAEENTLRLWISKRFASSEGIGDADSAAGLRIEFSCVPAGFDFRLGGRAAVAEAERLVAGFGDVAMMGQAVGQGDGETWRLAKTAVHSADNRRTQVTGGRARIKVKLGHKPQTRLTRLTSCPVSSEASLATSVRPAAY